MKAMIHLGALSIGAALLCISPMGQAQPAPSLNQYAVKIICGKAGTDPAVLAPGQYFTAVNVHNPGRTPTAVAHFLKKVALAHPDQKPGKVSKFIEGKLGPDEAMEVECRELARMAGVPPGPLFSGYLVFETKQGVELDIVAVYTAAGGAGVSALHTERVPKRVIL